MKGQKKYCSGCDSNFYNGNNQMGIKECWHFGKSKTVKRFRIGWWTPQDRASNFSEVETNNCHTATGHYADYEKLPPHLLRKKEVAQQEE